MGEKQIVACGPATSGAFLFGKLNHEMTEAETMKSLRLALVAVFGFVLGALLFHTPTVKAQGGAKVQSIQPGMGSTHISGTPIGISCVPEGTQGTLCYVLTQ